MNLLHFIFMYMLTVTLWNYIWTFHILSLCIWSSLPYETLYELSVFYLHIHGPLHPIKFIWNFGIFYLCISSPLPDETWYDPSTFLLHVSGHLCPMKLYINLPHFLLMYMVTFTLWNILWTFGSLSFCIWSPLPYETLCELSTVYLQVYGLLYPVELYMNLPNFILMYMVMGTIWNFIWTFFSFSSCIWSPLPYETFDKPSAVYVYVGVHVYPMKLYMNLPHFISIYIVTFSLQNFI